MFFFVFAFAAMPNVPYGQLTSNSN
jgi:hypothetical protein